MTDINLLPWRETRREKDKQDFIVLVSLAAILALCIALLINYYAITLVDNQTARNQRLKDEITAFDNQIASIKKLKSLRENLVARMKVAQSLQSKRALTVHLFDELVKVLPDGVYFTNVKRVENRITVNGYSESNGNIALLMRNIEANPWIQEPSLTEIKMDDEIASTTSAQKSDSKAERNPTFILSFILKPKEPVGLKPAVKP